MTKPRPVIAGNWKMNGTGSSLAELKAMSDSLAAVASPALVLICPPATLLDRARGLTGPNPVIHLGGQDCHANSTGAHTGDVSADMLRDAGAEFVILGHSERRADHGESSKAVAAKVEAGVKAGLIPIICIGETLAQRESGETLAVVTDQLDGSVPAAVTADILIAYEPVWAIGTGLTPTLPQILEVHAAIRSWLTARFGETGADVAILYGGSVKPANAAEILGLDNVNGALVGGASLKASDFEGIIRAAG